ncbi:MAG TPA: LPD1 domain-containing protein, partial [Rhodocyclaceae bacterium]|nr:LPD1 domain-containing protein [Rhodocyclaceae bacterium]
MPAAEDQKAANRAKLEEAKRKHEEAAADAASAEAKHDKAVAEVERETFTAVASLPAILNAAENSPDNFNIEADRQVAKWMAEQLSAAAASGDSQRAKAFDAMFKDGRPVLPESFYAGLLKEAEQKIKARAAEQVKDAARTAMIQASLQNGIIDDEDRAKFYDGWGHALAGKTKSTLSGEIPQKGYEAGRKWMLTEDGKAAASGKRSKKLENTGVDLRRWFDEQKAKIKEGDTDTVLLALDGATNRAELFRNLVDSAQTPGAKRWVEGFRNKVLPFKRWLTEKGPLTNTWGEWSLMRRGASDSEKIRGYLDAKLHQQTKVDAAGYGKDQPREDRIKVLRQAAEEYVDLVTTLTDGLEGKTVQELATSLSALMLKEGTATNPNNYYSDGIYKEGAMELRALLLKGKYDVDRFAWFDSGSSRTVRSLVESEAKESAPADRKAALTPPRLDRVDRDGEDFRKGKNITPQEFKKTLGFADVGFGKWVAAKQDQDHLNYAYDAFRDLAALLGIPPESVSLGGRLHFTIGALGHGKFAAHYQGSQPHPDGGTVPVINVTNTRGDGTVAHEWSHALDLTPQDGNEALRAAINELRADLTYAYDFGKMRSSVLSMLKGTSFWKGDRKAASSDAGKLDNAQRAIDYYSASSKQASSYYQEALGLDGGGKKDPYWSNGKELFARAFEAWVTDRLEKSNTYLINPEWSSDGAVTKATHRGTPYPTGEERERFNRWFDALAKSLRYEGKTLTVDGDKWAANKPTDRADWKRMLADFKAELPSLLEGVKRESEAKAQEQKDAEAHAATMRVGDLVVSREATAWSGKYTTPTAITEITKGTDNKTIYLHFDGSANVLAAEYFTVVKQASEIAAEAAQDAAAPEVKTAPTGELSESDLSALFDEAAAELQESKQEKPKAKAPGETMQKASDAPSADDMALLRKLVEDGKFVLLSGTDWARANQFPTIHDVALLVGTGTEVEHKGYGVFKVSKRGFEGNFDGGSLMQRSPSGMAYTTLSVSRGEFNNYPKTRVLEALTPAAAAKLPTTEQQQDKTAAKLAAEAAKLGVQGIDEAMKGLV